MRQLLLDLAQFLLIIWVVAELVMLSEDVHPLQQDRQMFLQDKKTMKLYEITDKKNVNEFWADIAGDALKSVGRWIGGKSRSRMDEPGIRKIPSRPTAIDNDTEEDSKSGFTSGSATKWDRTIIRKRQRNN
jgi:hypothetical protein